jgi:hypothetical protein
MSVIVTSTSRRRITPVQGRVYTVPVVRELPLQPAGPLGDLTW